MALEKSTASRGLLAVQYNEADLYGYTDENVDAAQAFSSRARRPAHLELRVGDHPPGDGSLSCPRRSERVVDLTDPATLDELESYIPLIQQGRGAEVLY